MKATKKILALLLVAVMILAMNITASAASITINRDPSYDSEATGNTVYTYFKIMDASINGNAVAYTVDSAEKAAALNGTGLFEATLGSDGLYHVTLTDPATTGEAIAVALDTMVAANATLFPGTEVASQGATTTISGLDEGYYLLKASNGNKLAVQTLGDVTINEKNPYPPIDKKQKKENGTWEDDPLPAEIGTYIDYQITIEVPASANKPIQVVDVMSAGLEYDAATGLTVTPASATYTNLTSEDTAYNANATWQIKFSAEVVEALQGQTITITYRALVTEDALVDTGKENEVTLDYDNGHYVLPDEVNYETYFGGIYKIDPEDEQADMSGVKFALTDENDQPVKVKFVENGGYYVPDPNGSNEVETKWDEGLGKYTIKIRGLDNDKTYTLTETQPKAGYNPLNGPVTLTLHKDEGNAFANATLQAYTEVQNVKGSQLPSTGGIGTTLFYVFGSLMVLGALVFFITKRRMNAAE